MGRVRPLCPDISDVNFLGNLDGIINLDAKVAHCTVNFVMSKQKLYGTQVTSSTVDKSCFGPAKGVRTELQRIKTDTGDPFANQSRVLSRRQAAPGTAAPGKQEITSFPAGHPQVFIKGQPRLLCQFETNGSAGLLLPDCRTIESVAIRGHVVDPDRHDIASA